jgi:hypothetical protein
MRRRLLSASLGCCAFLFSACATVPTGTVQTHWIQTLWDSPVKVTRIYLGHSGYSNVQSAAGYVWVTQASTFSTKTIRIDPKSNGVTELSRPGSEVPDFLVDEKSIWYSDGTALRRVDIETNQVTATIEAVGIPFALGDGAVWTYNRRTQVVTGINTNTNQIRTQLATQGRPYDPGSFAFGAGSIWQFTYADSASWWQEHGRNLMTNQSTPLPGVVRRIDPHTKKVISEIPAGLFTTAADPDVSPDRIHFVAGAIWVLGKSADSSILNPGHIAPFVKRIDVETNQVTATILLEPIHVTALEPKVPCRDYSTPKTPVFLDGGVWISMHCGWSKSALLKIDLQTNQIDEEFVLDFNHPGLAATKGTLWGVGWDSAIRVDF